MVSLRGDTTTSSDGVFFTNHGQSYVVCALEWRVIDTLTHTKGYTQTTNSGAEEAAERTIQRTRVLKELQLQSLAIVLFPTGVPLKGFDGLKSSALTPTQHRPWTVSLRLHSAFRMWL